MKDLFKLPEISDINHQYGEYNLLSKVQAKDSKDLDTLIFEKVRSITGVIATETLTGLSSDEII